MRRHLWNESYSDYHPPLWPCPACGRETLSPIPQSFKVEYPSGFDRVDLSPLDYTYRFTQLFRCSVQECGDVAAIAGTAELRENPEVQNTEDRYYYRLFPHAVHRGLPIIEIPPETPDSVKNNIELAFSLYWVDFGATANKLRISVERLLDEIEIPKAANLNARIENLQKFDANHVETFHALREVGNVGSHEGDNTRQTILDAFELYEYALRDLFGHHRARLEELRNRIRSRKGK